MRRMAMLLSACGLMAVCASVRAEDNPMYTQWAKFKPGTSTTIVTSSEAAGQTSKTETKTTLSEVTPDKVVIETAMSMEAGGQKMDMPAQKTEIPKKMETPPATPNATPAAQPDMPKPVSKTSDASVTVPAGTFKGKLTESTMEMAGSKTTSKVWTSDDVPGGMVKMESVTDGAMKATAKSELKAFDKK